MADIYDLYKPLRNHLRQISLMDSLGVIRAYIQHLQFNQPLPRDIQVDQSFLNAKTRYEKSVYEWELEILAKEIILNSENLSVKTLKQWSYFSGAINKLKDLENNISARHQESLSSNILLEMYRLSHRQFPWQTLPNLICLTRYYKIFSHPEIDKIIQKNIGLTTKELYTLGIAFTGVYIDYFALFYPPDLQIVGIDKVKLDKFLDHFSIDMDSIKKEIEKTQLYSHDYVYSFNPLRIKPLIRTIHNGKDSLICPVPTYLFRRFTEGVYYEICKDKNFANPFGQTFQKYIGEVLEKSQNSNQCHIFTETEYYVGKDRKDSVDWILVDGEANLFIECKTKKLRMDAKITLIDNKALEEDLDLMADFIVKTYKTIADYQKGFYPKLKCNNKPIFPMVVTMEEWFILGDKIIIQELDTRVARRLEVALIDKSILQSMPYSVCSTNDFERMMQIINVVGINKFMSEKTSGEKRLWPFQSFMFNNFADEFTKLRDLFPNEHKEINPSILD